MSIRRAGAAGYTFVELLVVSAILAILASAVMPLTKVAMQRQREVTLRRDLREIRTAIDAFKDAADQGVIAPDVLDDENQGYPPSLDRLVEGVPVADDESGQARVRFLRRIPIDPMTGTTDWQLRSYQDDPDNRIWGGENVYDVRTRSDRRALDGTYYRDW